MRRARAWGPASNDSSSPLAHCNRLPARHAPACCFAAGTLTALSPCPASPPLHITGGSLSTDDAVSAALESVLYAQMLVLFAPQAVPARSHLPVLVRCGAAPRGGDRMHTMLAYDASMVQLHAG